MPRTDKPAPANVFGDWAMTDSGPGNVDGKIEPERLELRARPRPVTRINRKVLYGGSAVALLLISGAVLIALDPPDWRTFWYKRSSNAARDCLKPVVLTLARLLEITVSRVACASSPVFATQRAWFILLLHRKILPKNYAVTMPTR